MQETAIEGEKVSVCERNVVGEDCRSVLKSKTEEEWKGLGNNP